ncbi:putative Protein kinase domain containing protein [Leishmania shawi]|uniref:non-specific serine/threonine protein kinase n=1 Tax=Leishmania shawi TaxID=5680 RepID=A0AAW3C8Q1_9TRYP
MPLTSTSLHWSEGNSGGSDVNNGCRSLSKTSSHPNHFTSPDRSSSSSSSSRFAMARPRDATRDQRTASIKARFEWLKPWRTPQDCREGGLTLLYSMQDILARQASMHEPHAVRSTGISAASTTSSCPHQHFWPPPARGGGSVGREGSCSAADSGASSLDQRSRRGRGEHNSLFAGSAPCLRNDRLQEVPSPVDVERTPPSPVVETAATAALAATRTAMAPLLTPPLPLSSAASVPPMVPAIPHFEEVKAEQEMISQRQQHPHPRSEAARRLRRALANSDDDDAGSSGPHHPEASCAGGKCDQTARPGDSRHHPCLRDEWDCSDGSEDELQSPLRRRNAASGFTDEVSEKDRKTSCGDGGHLACVPGDTLHQRYTLLKVLGVGRSSRVWLAADLEQCSLARRQLIRELGEGEVRRLFRTSERPMFVAIKVFRCDTVCAESALYELQLSTFVKENVQQQQRCAPPSASYSASLPPSLTAVAPAGDGHGEHLQESSDREKCGTSWPRDGAAGRTRVSLVSPVVPRLPTSSTPRSCPSTEVAGVAPSDNVAFARSAAACTTARDLSSRLTTLHHAFAVEGAFGIHHCLVMDVLGAGVDRAINEAHLDGLPSAVARSIMQSSLQGAGSAGGLPYYSYESEAGEPSLR